MGVLKTNIAKLQISNFFIYSFVVLNASCIVICWIGMSDIFFSSVTPCSIIGSRQSISAEMEQNAFTLSK